MQQYKSIYFSDIPAESSQQRNLTIAFGEKDAELYRAIRHLSSDELRGHLGFTSYNELADAARRADLPINRFCVKLLRESAGNYRQATFLGEQADDEASEWRIDPIQVTFRGGQAEPLHGWYPYLEGYSPAFVESVVRRYAPAARRILDPFAGSGTTPLTVARMSREALFCEVNPLMQFVITTKSAVMTADAKTRQRIAGHLRSFAAQLESSLLQTKPALDLDLAYENSFGESRFFRPDVYESVLRCRTLIDELGCADELAANLAEVAVLATMIPVSLMIRRGDVRRKNQKELERSSFDFAGMLSSQIGVIVRDIGLAPMISKPPLLLCEDARNLGNLPYLGIDAVITSPPYMNGTNYFRNSKMELWFMRSLRSADELAAYRYKAVTAGINDVTVGKVSHYANGNHARELVSRLEASNYDARIPRMAALYFSEMASIFEQIAQHLTDGGIVVIDIGDSSFGSVQVPTDHLLVGILEDQGFALEDEVVLRTRKSRGGDSLHQVLLQFKRKTAVNGAAFSPPAPREFTREAEWRAFTSTMAHRHGEKAKRNWGHPLHSLCSYQGKIKPSLAAELVRTFLSPEERVLDPFAGVGTIPFEAAMLGVKSWGFDISPSAVAISAAKLGQPQETECNDAIDRLRAFVTNNRVFEPERMAASKIRFNGDLPDYFESRTFEEVLLARRFFMDNPPRTASECLVFASMLHILHGNRPYALSRRSHPITPFAPSGAFEYRAVVPRLTDKVERSLKVKLPETFIPGQALMQDATRWWPHEVNDLDAIITSPPFFDSTRFYLANWMRLWFAGWEAEDFKARPRAFVDERQKLDLRVYQSVFRQARERLKSTGVFVLHLGKSRKCNMAEQLAAIARPWFTVAGTFEESVADGESHGIRDKGTVTAHQYLVLT